MVAPQSATSRRHSFIETKRLSNPSKPAFRFFILAPNEFGRTTFLHQIRHLSLLHDAKRSSNNEHVSRRWSLKTVKRVFTFLHKNYTRLSRTNSYVVNVDADSVDSAEENLHRNEYKFNYKGNTYSFAYSCVEHFENEHELLDLTLDRWLKEEPFGKNFVLYVVPLVDGATERIGNDDDNALDDTVNRFQRILNNEKLKNTNFVLFFHNSEDTKKKFTEEYDIGGKHDLKRRERISKTDTKYSKHNNKKVLIKRFQDAVTAAKRDEALYCRFTNMSDKGCLEAIKDIVKMNILNELINDSMTLFE